MAAILPALTTVGFEGVEFDSVESRIPNARQGQTDVHEGAPAHLDDHFAGHFFGGFGFGQSLSLDKGVRDKGSL